MLSTGHNEASKGSQQGNHVLSPPFKTPCSWPAAGKAASCSICSKPWEHADFYTNATIIVGIIMQVVDLLVIFLYCKNCTHLNALKNTKWKSKTNKIGKTTFCNMWCTCIAANGMLPLETSHTVAYQCWKASFKLTLQHVECSTMRGEHKPKHPEGGSGWEAAPHTCSHEVEYCSSFRDKVPLKLFVLSSEGRENLPFVFLTKF